MKIIAISGKRQRGKDTAAKILSELIPGSEIVHWADVLKQVCAIILGCKKSDFEVDEFKNSKIGGVYGDLTYRGFLIEFGTTCGRAINPLIWIDALCRNADPGTTYIIPDTRFFNEAQFTEKSPSNLLFRVERDGVDESKVPENILKNSTECELDNYPFKYVIHNNGTIDELKDKLIDMYIEWIAEEYFDHISPGLN